MNNYDIYSIKSNLIIDKKTHYKIENKIKVITQKEKEIIYKTIYFNNINKEIKHTIKNTLNFYLKIYNISKGSHIFIVGIGNDNYTSDSVGPKTLKYVKVNSYLNNFGIMNNKTIISALEPGVLAETGILTDKTISCIANEIKPDLIILIDSFISNNINNLNHTIEIANKSIKSFFNIPTITIGVTTAVEVKFSNKSFNYKPYILSTKDIDKYVDSISKIVGTAINEVINDL